MIAVALTELSVGFREADPEFAEWAWQLAADRLVEHDADPYDADEALESGRSRRTVLENTSNPPG
ncbi:hypothetical protein NDO75_19245 [Natrinema sp. 1APR25-10V2]|nr:hypothetical protein [Natrinema sp. 1APR25-10V2]